MRSSKSDKLATIAAQAKEQATELSERVGPALSDARDRLGPALEDARDRLGPALEDARERITPVLEDARDRAVPAATAARDAARVKLAATAATVATRLDERLPDDRTPQFIATAAASADKKGGKLRKLVVLAGLGALAAVGVKRLQGSPEPTWQAATPPPAPSRQPAGAADAAPSSGAKPGDQVGDQAGGTPGEVASDAVDEPREPTTPDAPAEQVDVSKS